MAGHRYYGNQTVYYLHCKYHGNTIDIKINGNNSY